MSSESHRPEQTCLSCEPCVCAGPLAAAQIAPSSSTSTSPLEKQLKRKSVDRIPRIPSDVDTGQEKMDSTKHQIEKVLDEIGRSEAQLRDLKEQCALSTENLQTKLHAMRANKKADEADRARVKLELKALEERKRTLESARRDADRRLQSLQRQLANSRANQKRMTDEMDRRQKALDAAKIRGVTMHADALSRTQQLRELIRTRKTELAAAEKATSELLQQVKSCTEENAYADLALKQAKKERAERSEELLLHHRHLTQIFSQQNQSKFYRPTGLFNCLNHPSSMLNPGRPPVHVSAQQISQLHSTHASRITSSNESDPSTAPRSLSAES